MPTTKWEYKLIRYVEEAGGDTVERLIHIPQDSGPRPRSFSVKQLDEVLVQLGREGWELITSSPTRLGRDETPMGPSDGIALIFKRQIES